MSDRVLIEMRSIANERKKILQTNEHRIAQQTAIIRLGMRRKWTVPHEEDNFPNRHARRANQAFARSLKGKKAAIQKAWVEESAHAVAENRIPNYGLKALVTAVTRQVSRIFGKGAR